VAAAPLTGLRYDGVVSQRWDETWHRLLEWTNGQGPSERLAAQILLSEGYTDLDPSHPLGGPDGVKDALCERDGKKWIMAVYFPRGKKRIGAIKRKLSHDIKGVAANGVDALAFVTNQELSLADRTMLTRAVGHASVQLYHLDRIATILDQPRMAGVRKQFLRIDFDPSVPSALNALVAPGRDESEIREAIVGIAACQDELLTRGVDPGACRCSKCGSANVREHFGSYDDELVSVTTCGDCGEHLSDCV
jgi:hypothetical protein